MEQIVHDYVTTTKLKTYLDLKEYLNTLSEDVLNQEIKYWGDSIAGNLQTIDLLHEDFINPSGDGCEPISVYKNDDIEYDFDFEDEEISYTKGTLIFSTN